AVAPAGRRGAEAAQDPRLLGQAPDAATQQEPRAAPAKAAEPVMRIFAKAEEPSFPADPRGARSAEGAAEGRSSGRGGDASSDARSNGRGEAAVGDGRSGGRGEASSEGRSGRGEASSEGRSNGRGEAASSDGRSGRGESSSGDLRSNGRGEAASSDGRSGRGADGADGRSSSRNSDASATESRSGRGSDDDEPSESRSSSRGGRNPRASGAVSSVNARGPRASAAQGAVRSSGVQGENSSAGRPRKGEPPPDVSGVRSSARRLPPSVSGLHTLPTTRATQAKPARSGPSSMMWMIILAVAGVVLGAGGGYLYLRVRQAQAAKNSPTPATPGASAAAGGIMAADHCPDGMRLVSGGSFKKGASPEDLQASGSTDEMRMDSVMVDSFCVDEFEFPNQAGRKPRVNMTWLDAKSSCEGIGKRLCSEDEWEKACKGPGNARFSSGGEQAQTACNTGTTGGAARALAPSGAHQACRSGYGAADLSGNAAEWTASNYPDTEDRLIKGGAFNTPGDTARCAARRRGAVSLKAPDVGFRCCQNVLR
ncbi:SUMF1/EgtB/PvdO family nonheme iron enzyme, partial [Corallococcus sp. 4LFB]|uniref:SUMF1/EgtB/PvdO family nonheme iron enzyme n=1 Tax=Corallococcus sp. 4LFB TaxID=3383249 RepID=UPI00397587C6